MYNITALSFVLFFLVVLCFCILYNPYFYNISTTNENYTSVIHKNYTAVIIEPREHKALSFVLKNFLENLSDNWTILIMHGEKNVDFVNNIIDNDLSNYKHRIQLQNLHVDNLTIDDYNQLLLSEYFYQYIPTEIFLIFQTDTMICNTQKLDDFLQYDYVGAPWLDSIQTDKVGGNGGLSIRRKSKMLEKIRHCEHTKNQYEDKFFSNSCGNLYFPHFEKAKEFAIETVYHDKSFGIHKPWPYLKKEELESVAKQCRNFNTLVELNR
jgi:hypothetical protein